MKSLNSTSSRLRGGSLSPETAFSGDRVDDEIVSATGGGETRRFTHGAREPSYFQVMRCCNRADSHDLTGARRELALACAAHGGEPEQVRSTERMYQPGLERASCGPHEPLSTAARAAAAPGERATRLTTIARAARGMMACGTGGCDSTDTSAKGPRRAEGLFWTSVEHWTGMEGRHRHAVDGWARGVCDAAWSRWARLPRLARAETPGETGMLQRVLGACRRAASDWRAVNDSTRV